MPTDVYQVSVKASDVAILLCLFCSLPIPMTTVVMTTTRTVSSTILLSFYHSLIITSALVGGSGVGVGVDVWVGGVHVQNKWDVQTSWRAMQVVHSECPKQVVKKMISFLDLRALNPTGAIVDCRRFIESGCWSYLLSALASFCAEVRAASYHCLVQFRGHLEGARFREKTQVGGYMRPCVCACMLASVCVV